MSSRRLVFFRMKSGQLLYRLQNAGEKKPPPYGSDAWAMSDKGPWRPLTGEWIEEDGKVRWVTHGNDQGRQDGA